MNPIENNAPDATEQTPETSQADWPPLRFQLCFTTDDGLGIPPTYEPPSEGGVK
jgi:hypothetical protein